MNGGKYRVVVGVVGVVGVVAALTVSACSGTQGARISLQDQKINGVADTPTQAMAALPEFAKGTGANIDNAQCFTRIEIDEDVMGGDSPDRYPVAVDCLAVGFLGGTDLNMVSFPVTLDTDPEHPKELLSTVDTAQPTVGTFVAGQDEFIPKLPEKLPRAGKATTPDGSIVIDRYLVRSDDLDTAITDAIEAMKADDTYPAEDKLTFADDPTCLFTADLVRLWCGPAVSFSRPDGVVFGIDATIPKLDLTTYEGIDAWRSENVELGSERWSDAGQQPGSLIDASGKSAQLPAVSSIEPPELPTVPSNEFVELDGGQQLLNGCIQVDRAEPLCDEAAEARLESQPSTLWFTSGSLKIEAVAFGDQTGDPTFPNLQDTEKAAPGETLIGLRVELERNEQVLDTEPLNAQLLVDGQVKADWGGIATSKAFFMSVTTDSSVTLRLLSGGETQDLVLAQDTITRVTNRPELYAERSLYRFSGDQRWTDQHADTRQIMVASRDYAYESDSIETEGWIVINQVPTVAPAGQVILTPHINLNLFNQGGDTVNCAAQLKLADGSLVDAMQIDGHNCRLTQAGFIISFAIRPDADVVSLEIGSFQYGEFVIAPMSIPAIPAG